jgi:hypothetical protein
MTATAAMENATGAGKISTRDDRLHRGRKVTMAFLMQGWGQFFNQAILIVLLLVFHHGQGSPPYRESRPMDLPGLVCNPGCWYSLACL